MKPTIYTLLLFFLIYSFPIYQNVNSAYVSVVIALLLLQISTGGISTLVNLVRYKSAMLIVFIYVILILYASMNTLIIGAYDFSMIKTLLNNIFSIISCLIFAALFFSWFNDKEDIEKYLTLILIIQSVVILVMLISPEVRDYIQSFLRTDDEIERMLVYGGVRGLGISGFVAFGLSATMGLLGLIYLYWSAVKLNIPSGLRFFIYIVCFIASLSAGRTAILGFIIGLIFFLFERSTLECIRMFMRQGIYFFIFSCILYFLIVSNEQVFFLAEMYSKYVFQFLYHYYDTGYIAVSSLEHLETMYFIPDEGSWLFGDGKYTNSDGSYYMHTDAGYMRSILYYGVVGSLISYISFVVFCLYFANRAKGINHFSMFFYISIIFYSFVLQYKGEVIFFSVPYMKIVFLLGFVYVYKYDHKLNSNQEK